MNSTEFITIVICMVAFAVLHFYGLTLVADRILERRLAAPTASTEPSTESAANKTEDRSQWPIT